MSVPETCEDPFLIIPGVAKAGTTSLHQYLSAHPDVCGSIPKEPFYFLPPDFPRETRIRLGRDPLRDYLAVFANYRAGQVRLESSPLYLLVPGVAVRIKSVLPNARALIMLREPISRLMSYHLMATQFGWLPRDLSFDAYVREVIRLRNDPAASPYFRYPIEEGRYADRCREWQQVLGKECVMIAWFDELQSSPRTVVTRACEFAGIDGAFFRDYPFQNVNPGRAIRNEFAYDAYFRLKQFLMSRLARGSRIRRILGTIRRRIELPLYYRLFTRPPPEQGPDPATLAQLRAFYADDVAALKAVVERPVPWADQYQGQ